MNVLMLPSYSRKVVSASTGISIIDSTSLGVCFEHFQSCASERLDLISNSAGLA